MLWSRVDAQRTMIAMGEMVSSCEEKEKMLMTILGNASREMVWVKGEEWSETRRREKRNSCMALDDLHGQ